MIYTHLDLDTRHVRLETMNALSEPHGGNRVDWPAMTIAPYEYGCFITCPCWGETSIEQLEALPPDLLAVFRFAQQHGIPVVRFDASGDTLNELPTYEW